MKKLFVFLSLCIIAALFISARASQWRKVRKEHLRKYPYCAFCLKTKKLSVHHIIPYAENPALELDPDNLITLCTKRYCHLMIGHFGNYKLYNPDVKAHCSRYQWERAKAKIIDGNSDT